MKGWKKVVSLLTAAAIALMTAVPSFALVSTELEGKDVYIEIDGGSEGRTYNAYKIFDVTISSTDPDATGFATNDNYTYYINRQLKDANGNITGPNPWFAFLANEESSEVVMGTSDLQDQFNTLKSNLTAARTALNDANDDYSEASEIAYVIRMAKHDIDSVIAAEESRFDELNNQIAVMTDAMEAASTDASKNEYAKQIRLLQGIRDGYQTMLGVANTPNVSGTQALPATLAALRGSDTDASSGNTMYAFLNGLNTEISDLRSQDTAAGTTTHASEITRLEALAANVSSWITEVNSMITEVSAATATTYNISGPDSGESIAADGCYRYLSATAQTNLDNASTEADSKRVDMESAQAAYDAALQAITNFLEQRNEGSTQLAHNIASIKTTYFYITMSQEDDNKYNVARNDNKMVDDDITGMMGYDVSEVARILYDEIQAHPSKYTPDATISGYNPDSNYRMQVDSLGYYFVTSSLGSLAALNTSTVQPENDGSYVFKVYEKNGMPTMSKKVFNAEADRYVEQTTTAISETVTFRTEITDAVGTSHRLVLHDKMPAGLVLEDISVYRPILTAGQTTIDDIQRGASVMGLPGRYPSAVHRDGVYYPSEEAYRRVTEGQDYLIDITEYRHESRTEVVEGGSAVTTNYTLPNYQYVLKDTYTIYYYEGDGTSYEPADFKDSNGNSLPDGSGSTERIQPNAGDTFIIVFSDAFITWLTKGKASTATPFERNDTVRVEYTARLDGHGITNNDHMKYSNIAYFDYDGTTSENDPADVYSLLVDFQKIDREDPPAQLEGAQFALYDSTGYNRILLYKLADTTITNAKEDNKTAAVYRLARAEEIAIFNKAGTLTADETIIKENLTYVMEFGYSRIRGIGEGIYNLREIKAPEGYNIMQEPLRFEVRVARSDDEETIAFADSTKKYSSNLAQGLYVGDENDKIVSKSIVNLANGTAFEDNIITVVNGTGTILPQTGGIGTRIFYIIGGILVVGAGIVLVARRRMKEDGEE